MVQIIGLIIYTLEPAIALEINGEDVFSAIQKYAAEFASIHKETLSKIMYISPEGIAQDQIGKIFEQVNIEI
jgi:hypothetical protein